MITLFGFGAGFGLPEISPFVTKTEVQLRMASTSPRSPGCSRVTSMQSLVTLSGQTKHCPIQPGGSIQMP